MRNQLKYFIIIVLSTLIIVNKLSADKNNQVDSLKALLNIELDDSAKIELEFKLFEIYTEADSNIVDIAKLNLERIESKNKVISTNEYFFIAQYQRVLGNYYKSEEYFLEAIEYFRKQNNFQRITESYYWLAYIALYQGQPIKSIEYSQKEYNLAVGHNFTEYKIKGLTLIGTAYDDLLDFDRSEKYLKEAYQLAVNYNEQEELINIFEYLAVLKDRLADYDSSIIYHNKALELAQQLGHEKYISKIYQNMGITYANSGSLEKGLEYYLQSYEIKKKNNFSDKVALMINLGNIGRTYKNLKEYEKAKQFLEERLQISLNYKNNRLIYYSYWMLADLYYNLPNYELAWKYQLLYKKYKDLYDAENNNKYLADLQTQFETERKKTQAQILEKENQINELKLKRKRFLLAALIALAISTVIIALIIYKRNKMRIQQKIVDLKQQNLRNQMNPHFIFNTLNSIQYFLFKNDKSSSSKYLTKFARLLNLIFENSKSNSVSINDELEALRLYLELEKLRFKEKLEYTIEIDENIDLLDYKIPPLILQPFVENSILHGIMPKQERGNIEIELKLIDEIITCSIKDNGIGREKAMEIKMQKDISHKSLGTKISEDRIKNFNLLYRKKLKVNYVDLKDEVNNPLGTKVLLSFPVIS